MKKLFLILTVFFAATFGVSAVQVDFELMPYFSDPKSFNVDFGKALGTSKKVSLGALMGFGASADVYLYNFNKDLSIGASAGAGVDFNVQGDIEFDGKPTCWEFPVCFNLTIGPSLKYSLVKRISLFFTPTFTFDFVWAKSFASFFNGDESKGANARIRFFTFSFDIRTGAKIWINRHVGVIAGLDFRFPLAGKCKIEDYYFDKKTVDGKFDVIPGGFILDVKFGIAIQLFN